ncbi:hypothetical protein JCM10296v2_005405 [Rhodotorula toruloides]
MLDVAEISLVLRGTLVSPQIDRSFAIREDCTVVVDSKGFIAAIDDSTGSALADEVDTLVREGKVGRDEVVELGDGWVLPGFVDTHIHAPQYTNAGMALDKPLMEWLEAYTFAAESRIDKDPAHAQRVYRKLVQRLLENGTTAASVFGTISVEANLTLAKAFLDAGPLPFKIKRPRSLEQVQQNLGKRLAKRGEEGNKTERVPFAEQSATAAAAGGSAGGQGTAGSGRATQRVTSGGSRGTAGAGGAGGGGGSVAAAQPVPSTTQTVATGSKIVSTGLLTVASPSAAAGGGGTVTQVETASSGVLITSTAGAASSAAMSDGPSAQAAEATSSTSMISGGAGAAGSLNRMLAGGVAGAALILLVR